MKSVTKVEIEIEVYESLYVIDGEPILSNHAYVGDADNPFFESEISLCKLLDKYIEENSIPGGTITENHRQEILNGLESIQKLVEKKIKQVNEMPLFNKG